MLLLLSSQVVFPQFSALSMHKQHTGMHVV